VKPDETPEPPPITPADLGELVRRIEAAGDPVAQTQEAMACGATGGVAGPYQWMELAGVRANASMPSLLPAAWLATARQKILDMEAALAAEEAEEEISE